MRSIVMILAAVGLAACAPTVPDSGAGVGFQDYNTYNAPPPAPAAGFTPGGALAAIDKAEGRPATGVGTPLSAMPAAQPYPAQAYPVKAYPAQAYPVQYYSGPTGERPRGNAPAGIVETTSEMKGMVPTPGTVSDEQDFDAVSARETIESDKARIERNRAQYQVDQPGALPQRAGDTGPNIVEFALSTNHPKGTQVFRRSSLSLTKPGAACNKYPSPDLAQQAFLEAGGPVKDRKGLDPDGDGYACAWDPTPFRAAMN